MTKAVSIFLITILLLGCAGSGMAKDPFVAGVLSFLIPGLGQIYNGEGGKGALFFVGYAAGTGIAVAGASQTNEVDYGYGYTVEENDPNEAMLYGGLALSLTCAVWSIVDAATVASKTNDSYSQSGEGMLNLTFNGEKNLREHSVRLDVPRVDYNPSQREVDVTLVDVRF